MRRREAKEYKGNMYMERSYVDGGWNNAWTGCLSGMRDDTGIKKIASDKK